MMRVLLSLLSVALVSLVDAASPDSPQGKLFTYPWIALPGLPTRPPAGATLAPCTPTAAGAMLMPATAIATPCTCGSGTMSKNCVVGDICTVVTTTMAGTCTPKTTLQAAPAQCAGATPTPTTPSVCTCGPVATPAAQIICTLPMNGCNTAGAAPMCA